MKRGLPSCLLAISILCVAAAYAGQQGNEVSDDTVVAELGSNRVTYGQIRLSVEAIGKLRQGRIPEDQLQALRRSVESKTLRHKLEELVATEAMAHYGITSQMVSEATIKAAVAERMRAMFGRDTFTQEDAQKQHEQIISEIKLLETWQNNHEEGERLYQREFSDSITPQKWEEAKRQYNTPETLTEASRNLPLPSATAANAKVREAVVHKLMKDQLVGELRRDGKLRQEEGYRDWLDRKLNAAKIVRGDLVVDQPRALEHLDGRVFPNADTNDPVHFPLPTAPAPSVGDQR